MSDVKHKSKREYVDRRPREVPHHPRAMGVAIVLAVAALGLMTAWFWMVNTGQGMVLTAEQAKAAEAQAKEDAAADQAAAEDRTTADLEREAESREKSAADTTPDLDSAPRAPSANDVVTDAVELTNYSILSEQGKINVGGRLKNLTAQPLAGTVTAYVYMDGVAIAAASTDIAGLEAGKTAKVNLVSDADYQGGQKIVLLSFKPSS